VVVLSPDSLRVVLRDKATWPARVRNACTTSRLERKLADLNITPAALAALSSQAVLTTDYTQRKRNGVAGDKAVAFGVLLLVFMGVITGVSYLFTGITGEKPLRVTESISSSIFPVVRRAAHPTRDHVSGVVGVPGSRPSARRHDRWLAASGREGLRGWRADVWDGAVVG